MWSLSTPKVSSLPPADPFSLDTVLLHFGKDAWRIRDSFEGTSIMGQTGSGKSSTSGAAIAKRFLQLGYGGLVLCAKPGERELWQRYARECGREHHLFIVSPREDPYHHTHWRFNFLDYELNRAKDMGGGLTENLVTLLTTVTEIIENKASAAENDRYWTRAMHQLLRNTIDLLNLACDTLTLSDVLRIILEAPRSESQAQDEHWQQNSFCAQCLEEAHRRVHISGDPIARHDFEVVWNYFVKDYAGLDARTRSNIVSTYTSVADVLSHGYCHELLCTTTNLVPEYTFDGAIIVLDLPIQHFRSVGRASQGIIKYLYQLCVLARDVEREPRPVFLWGDEIQNFCSSFDFEFLAVARSARCATVFITQSISNYYAVLGAGGRDAANALLANLSTKLFHANGDIETNRWASETIGSHETTSHNYSSSQNAQGSSTSRGGSDTVKGKILPSDFTTLRRPAPPDYIAEGIVFQGGRIWQSGDTFMKVKFKQG